MKTCSRCGETKPKTEFGQRSSSKDGLHYRCKACNTLVSQESIAKKKKIIGTSAFNALHNKANKTHKTKKIKQIGVEAYTKQTTAACNASNNKKKILIGEKAFKKNQEKIHREFVKRKKSLLGEEGYNALRANKSVKSRIKKKINLGTVAYNHMQSMRSMLSNYGVTELEFQELMNKQQGCCKICGKDFAELPKRAHIDHDHETGEVRALLCGHCNALLGYAKDKSTTLINAVAYLEQWEYA